MVAVQPLDLLRDGILMTHMSLMAAPEKLPFAPRPYPTELLSSWLLRVAAANLVSLRELLDGFESRYGQILSNDPIDYGIPHEAVAALAQFCRVTPARVRALDLRERCASSHPCLASALSQHSFGLVSPVQPPPGPIRLLPFVFGQPARNLCPLGLERCMLHSLCDSPNSVDGRLPEVR
jgi:hypothetical protein